MSSKNLGPTLISDTFKHLLQVRDNDKTIFDGDGDLLDDFRVSGSFTTSEFIEIENGTSQTGNKLHSRGGTLYWGDINLETGGSGMSNIVEDSTPQLGGNLDLNSNTINGTGNTKFSGSLEVKSVNSTDDFFLLKSGSLDSLKVNNQGVLVLGGFTFEPTAIKGGLYYNDSEDEFYAGKNN